MDVEGRRVLQPKPPQDPEPERFRGFSFALGLFCLVLSVYVFLKSPFFSLEQLEFEGVQHLQEAELVTQSQLQLGTNIFAADLRAVERRLAANPYVAKAVANRRLPNRIRIRIEERVPVASLVFGDQVVVLDEQARVLGPATAVHTALPVITVAGLDGPAAPAEPSVNDRVRIAVRVAAELEAQLPKIVSEIHVGTDGEMVLFTRELMMIVFGSLVEIDEKLQALRLVLDRVYERGMAAAAIDLRVPSNPVVRQKR